MRKRWILITITVLSVILASTLFIEFRLAGSSQELPFPWMFKGAYATYEGHIQDLSTPCTLSAEIEVIDLNASHVQIRTTSTITPSFSSALTDHTILWINRTNINFQPKGETLAKTYNAQILGKSVGIRDCSVYEYTNEAINATYYVDKVLLWPIKITYTTVFENQTYIMEFNLNTTNIEGLS